MQVTLSIFDLRCLLAQTAELGAAAFQKRLEPTSDYISQREVKKWLKMMGQPDILRDLVKKGLVNAQRTGPSINSKIVYSRLELLTAITAINAHNSINE